METDQIMSILSAAGFVKGKIDPTLFIKTEGNDVIMVQVYVDDIIFGSTNPILCTNFSNLMTTRFEMSMLRELTFFLGLQVTQRPDGTFINQSKYLRDVLKKFQMETATLMKTPMQSGTLIGPALKGNRLIKRPIEVLLVRCYI